MNYYRLYFMNPKSGHIDRFAEYEAPDDEAALKLAAEHEGEASLELWCEHRKAARLDWVPAMSRPINSPSDASSGE